VQKYDEKEREAGGEERGKRGRKEKKKTSD